MEFSDDQLDRYARHIVLPEIGGAGQARLLDTHALVIGAGGIGCPLLAYLAAAGLGRVTVMDDDHVSLSNLQRQILFGSSDIGRAKVDAAQHALQHINAEIDIITVNQRFTAQHFSREEAAGFHVIIDGCDNFATRLAVNRFAVEHQIPLVSAAIGRFDLQIAIFDARRDDAPCYQCLVGDNPDPGAGNCAEQGVLGALAGVAGSLAALEAIRLAVPFGDDRADSLLMADMRDMRWRSVRIARDPGCTVCGKPGR
ncbi:MAG: HesA/MoeB/ThiF family protein [Blastomonas sp.]